MSVVDAVVHQLFEGSRHSPLTQERYRKQQELKESLEEAVRLHRRGCHKQADELVDKAVADMVEWHEDSRTWAKVYGACSIGALRVMVRSYDWRRLDDDLDGAVRVLEKKIGKIKVY